MRDQAELVVLHVGYPGDDEPSALLVRMAAEERRQLDEVVAELTQRGVVHVSAVLVRGHPWQQIVDKLHADPTFDLVVVGTRGRTGASRFLFGSVAEMVVRHAPCSVLVTGEGGETSLRRILCPVDFSTGSQHALTLIAATIGPDCDVTLFHVFEAPPTYATEPSLRTFEDDLDRDVAARLAKAADELRPTVAGSVHTRLVSGHPGEQILRALEASPPYDLVVMGSHGRMGIQRALLGSVAERIVRHSPCPVLVARSRRSA